MSISSSESIDVTTPVRPSSFSPCVPSFPSAYPPPRHTQEHSLLLLSLSRVLACYGLIDRVVDLAATPYPALEGDEGREEADGLVRELWGLLRPEKELPGMVGKHWQEVRPYFSLLSPNLPFACFPSAYLPFPFFHSSAFSKRPSLLDLSNFPSIFTLPSPAETPLPQPTFAASAC
jgi:hypothetical protein